ncbi:MAG: lipopolysaccharide biosynthesis protein [Eubacteriaceae bacterium]
MRLFNSLRNTFWNFIGQIILIFAGLFMKRVLLQTVGIENIGLNYLFNDIVILISIAELGLSGIIAYRLYDPLATGNEIKVKQIMDFFRKVYAFIGLIVIMLGFGLIPFLGYLVGETTLPYNYIIIVFVLFLIRSVEGYFFSYKQILIFADQKGFIITVVDIFTSIIYTIISIIVLLYTKNFIYVIVFEIIKKIINDIIIIGIVNKQYPFITKKDIKALEKLEIKMIIIDIKNAFISRMSKVVVRATDNIVISIFLGISTTGIFANYALLFDTIVNLLYQLITSIQASVGNLLVEEKREVIYSVLRKTTFISFFMVSICGCCLLQLSTPFVALWFGSKYTLAENIVWISVFNIFLHGTQLAIAQFADAGGLFEQNKKIDTMGCIINLILSIIGVALYGIVGVLIATFIAIALELYLRIRLVFMEILNIDYSRYIKQILLYFMFFTIEVVAVWVIGKSIYIQNPILEFVIYGFIAAIVPLIINIIVFRSSEDFIYMIDIIKMFFNKIKNIKN